MVNKKPRPHLAWSEDISALVEQARALIEHRSITTYRPIYWKVNGEYQTNISGVVQIVLIAFASAAPKLTRSQWSAFVKRYADLPMTSSKGLTLDDESMQAIDGIGEVVNQWPWKSQGFRIVARSKSHIAYRKLPLICFALFWFIETYTD